MRAQVSLLVWLLTRLGESLLLVAELTSRLKPVAEGASPRYLPPPYEAPEPTPAYAPPAPAPASPRFAYNFGGRGVSAAAAAPSPAVALAPEEEMDPREVGRQLAVEQMLKRSSAAAAASRKVEQAKSEMLQARQEEALRKVFEDKRKDQIGNARSSSAAASQPLRTALKARVLSAASGAPVSTRPLANRSPSSLSPDLKAALRPNATDAAENTPLHHAAHMGHKEIVGMLLDAGAKPSLMSRDSGSTALHLAAREGSPSMHTAPDPPRGSLGHLMLPGNRKPCPRPQAICKWWKCWPHDTRAWSLSTRRTSWAAQPCTLLRREATPTCAASSWRREPPSKRIAAIALLPTLLRPLATRSWPRFWPTAARSAESWLLSPLPLLPPFPSLVPLFVPLHMPCSCTAMARA